MLTTVRLANQKELVLNKNVSSALYNTSENLSKMVVPFGETSTLLVVGSCAGGKAIKTLAPGLVVGTSEGNQTLFLIIIELHLLVQF